MSSMELFCDAYLMNNCCECILQYDMKKKWTQCTRCHPCTTCLWFPEFRQIIEFLVNIISKNIFMNKMHRRYFFDFLFFGIWLMPSLIKIQALSQFNYVIQTSFCHEFVLHNLRFFALIFLRSTKLWIHISKFLSSVIFTEVRQL